MRRLSLLLATLAGLALTSTPAAAATRITNADLAASSPALAATLVTHADLAALPSATGAGALSAALTSSATGAAGQASCVSTAGATYRHSFDGAGGTVTITAVRPLCAGQTQAFSLVSYTVGATTGQFVYDTASATITATRRVVTLKVAIPDCHHQVDAFFGSAVRTETTSSADPYGSATLGAAGSRSAGPLAWHAAGSEACSPASAVTFTNACAGTFTATLTNAPTANVPAVFLTDGRRIRLSPGQSTKLRPAKGTTLTLRDSSFTTYVATWSTPTTACTPAGTGGGGGAGTAPKTAAPAQPAAATTATASPTPTPSSTWTTSTPEPANPVFSTNPAAMHPDNPTALAQTGRSTTSVLVIALGLLMIGGGITALTYLVRNTRRPI